MPPLRSAFSLLLFPLSQFVRHRLRLLEVHRPLVYGAPGDDPGNAFGFDFAQGLDVGEVGEPPARDHRHDELARQFDRGLDVDPVEHAVAADVSIDHGFDAIVLEFARQVDHVVPGHFRPALDRDLAVLGIQADDDMAGEGAAGVLQETGILHRCRADDDVADAVVEIALDGVQIADAAAQLYRDPAADCADDILDHALVARLARNRAIQINQVQPARALVQPMPGHRRRIVGEHGLLVHIALFEAYGAPLLDIDRGDDKHVSFWL